MKDLYHEEQNVLFEYVKKVKTKKIRLDDAFQMAVNYKDLLDQSKVITRISDRLQKKLDKANQKIKNQNQEINHKNKELEGTIDKLDKMTIGKKASRFMLVLFIILFVMEQVYLEPIIEEMINIQYLGIVILLMLALLLKFFESIITNYFLKQTKQKILKNKK